MQNSELKPYKIGTLCTHSSTNSNTSYVDIPCNQNQNTTHRVSQIGNICKKCASLIAKSVSSNKKICLCCQEQLQDYLKQRWICVHDNRTQDQLIIKCINNPNEQFHEITYKAKVCKSCNDKIRSAFMYATECVICAQKQNEIYENLSKTIIYPSYYYFEYVIRKKQEKKLNDEDLRMQFQSFCLSRYREQNKQNNRSTKIRYPDIAQEFGQNSQAYHISKRYQLYPRCPKHKKMPITVCNTCLVSLLNLQSCPYGCSYEKTNKAKRKIQTTKNFESGFVCLYPKSGKGYEYLEYFCIRMAQEVGRLQKWQGFLRKIKHTSKNKQQSIIPMFKLYGSAVQISQSSFLYTGGITLQNKNISNKAFQILFSKDRKQFTIETVQDMLESRASHTSVYHDGYVYIVGGFINGKSCLTSCQKYNTKTKKFQKMPAMKIQRSKPSVFYKDNYIYALGGLSPNSQLISNLVQRYNINKQSWQTIQYQGYNQLPSLTASTILSNTWNIPQHKNTILIGGSNYQQMTYIIQQLQIKQNTYDLTYNQQKLNYSRINPATSLIKTTKAQHYVILFFGGLQDHQSILSIDALRISTGKNKDIIKPMFAYDDVNLKSYRFMLREGINQAYQYMYNDLCKNGLMNSEKLEKDSDVKNLGKSQFNTHMIEKMWYGIGKTFVGLNTSQ